MRAIGESTELKAAAYAGTYVVVLAWNTLDGKPPARKNLLGYAIERAEFDFEGNETERYWLRGIKRFKDKDKGLPPGTPVEGLGTVQADLAIATLAGTAPPCTPGTARAIQEFDSGFPSYGTTPGTNGCLNGFRGFGDDPMCTLDYEFTFSPGTTVSCFSLLMLDFGDLFPYGTANHIVTMNAYAGATPWRSARRAARTAAWGRLRGGRGSGPVADRRPACTR